jgi:hypothetical protein
MIELWYFANKDKPSGPFTLAEVKDFLERDAGWEEFLVWRSGFSQWQTAGRVPEIAALFETPPPIPVIGTVGFPKGGRVKPRGRSGKKICLGITLFAAAAAGGAFERLLVWGRESFSVAPFSRSAAFDLEKELASAVLKIRMDLPKKIDATTVITGVWSEGTKMIFENLIVADTSKFDDATKEKLRQSVIKNVCGGAESRRIMDIGGSFRYRYADVEAKPVMTVDVVQRACS